MKMARPPKFNPQKWSKIFNKPYVQRDWHDYHFGGGFYSNYGGKRRRIGGSISNQTANHIFNRLNKVLDNIIEENWEYSASLYTAFIAFLFKDIKDQITYFDTDESKEKISLLQCIDNLSFPKWAKERMEKIFTLNLDFTKFLYACDKYIEKMNFDLQSALDAYMLQGDDAIFSILMQIFYYHKYMVTINVVLTPGLPIIWKPKISNFVTGTSFPVVVTPFPKYVEWVECDEGWFLQDSFGAVIDCAGVGLFSCSRDQLANRLSFCGRVGNVGEFPYVVCRTWKEITDAVKYFGVRNVLVRRMNENLIDTEYFKFGLDALLCVRVKNDGDIYGRHSGFPIKGYKVPGDFLKSRTEQVICSLSRKLIKPAVTESCVWSNGELEDWFLLGDMCRT